MLRRNRKYFIGNTNIMRFLQIFKNSLMPKCKNLKNYSPGGCRLKQNMIKSSSYSEIARLPRHFNLSWHRSVNHKSFYLTSCGITFVRSLKHVQIEHSRIKYQSKRGPGAECCGTSLIMINTRKYTFNAIVFLFTEIIRQYFAVNLKLYSPNLQQITSKTKYNITSD